MVEDVVAGCVMGSLSLPDARFHVGEFGFGR